MTYKSLLYITFILLFGCNYYSFKGTLPPNINSIYLAPISNLTSEYRLTNFLNSSINNALISENILEVVDFENAHSRLEIIIEKINNKPNIYNSQKDNYEVVEQWKLETKIKIIWYNLNTDEVVFDKNISEWAMYNNSGIDISLDGIDNDSDGLYDSEDSDEYGSPRESAIRIVANKVTDRILNELISTW